MVFFGATGLRSSNDVNTDVKALLEEMAHFLDPVAISSIFNVSTSPGTMAHICLMPGAHIVIQTNSFDLNISISCTLERLPDLDSFQDVFIECSLLDYLNLNLFEMDFPETEEPIPLRLLN